MNMLMQNTDKKIAWENSKSKKTPEMRWLKKEQNKYLQT